MNTKYKMITAIAALTLAVGAWTAAAQAQYQAVPLPIGVTNLISSNVVVNASGTNVTYITNAVPDYWPPLISNAIYSADTGGNQVALPGRPYSGIQNGWIRVPGDINGLTFVMTSTQPGSSQTGSWTNGYDLSWDGVNGTSSQPLKVVYTLSASGTNTYYSQMALTNLNGARYIRWDSAGGPAAAGMFIYTNTLNFWR